jgi:hypothetical protein
MDKKHKEFKVTLKYKIVKDNRVLVFDGKGFPEIDKKEPTSRGHVMISERDAEVNNRQTRFNFLHYELAEEIKSPERIALEAEAIELGVAFRANIGDDKLQAKIDEAKK